MNFSPMRPLRKSGVEVCNGETWSTTKSDFSFQACSKFNILFPTTGSCFKIVSRHIFFYRGLAAREKGIKENLSKNA